MVEALVTSMIHLPTNVTHKLKLMMDWDEIEKGIGHFQSYKYPHRLTYSLNSVIDWEKNRRVL